MKTCARLVYFSGWLDTEGSPYGKKLFEVFREKENEPLFSEISWLVLVNGHNRTIWLIKPYIFLLIWWILSQLGEVLRLKIPDGRWFNSTKIL
jgi:hypothetical protein